MNPLWATARFGLDELLDVFMTWLLKWGRVQQLAVGHGSEPLGRIGADGALE